MSFGVRNFFRFELSKFTQHQILCCQVESLVWPLQIGNFIRWNLSGRYSSRRLQRNFQPLPRILNWRMTVSSIDNLSRTKINWFTFHVEMLPARMLMCTVCNKSFTAQQIQFRDINHSPAVCKNDTRAVSNTIAKHVSFSLSLCLSHRESFRKCVHLSFLFLFLFPSLRRIYFSHIVDRSARRGHSEFSRIRY